MNKYELIKKIENFAPLETAEKWDCSGWGVETKNFEVSKVMLCLTVTNEIIEQAKSLNCEMIVSHHPVFYVPCSWSGIDIYSAHTNMDKASGGTTDTIIKVLGLDKYKIDVEHEFLRIVELNEEIDVADFAKVLSKISPNLRYINNKKTKSLKRIAFCAGSGSEFIHEAKELGAESLVTGDLKFHPALDSEIVVYDIGHFESEILILPVFNEIIDDGVEVLYAKENSPFKYIAY